MAMIHLLARHVRLSSLLFFSTIGIIATAQTTYPYNPDDNADGFIQVWDLQSFLALYGQEFQPEVAEESLQVTNLSNLPNGVVIAPTADVLDYPLGQNRWFYLPDPNSSTAHRIGVVHGGVATVSYVSQFNAYKLEVSSGYENANNYNLSVLMPFMGKWLVGR